jgi:hypothetical protein
MKNIVIFIIALLLAPGCGNRSDSADQSESGHEHADHDKEHAHDHGAESKSLQLNNGSKWQVNPEMMVYVAASEKLVGDFKPGPEGDYASLAKALDENKNQLIVNCTMQGASHDALHIWLEPYIGELSMLANAGSESEQSKALDAIKTSFDTFHNFFE